MSIIINSIVTFVLHWAERFCYWAARQRGPWNQTACLGVYPPWWQSGAASSTSEIINSERILSGAGNFWESFFLYCTTHRLHRWVKNGSFYFRAHKIETVPNSSGWDCYISGVFQTLCNQCGIHLSKCGLLRSNIIYHDKQNNTCMIECTDCTRYNNKERMSNIFIVIYSSTLDQYNSLDINVWIIN